MRVVFKYPVAPVMNIPRGAQLCHFGAQNGEMFTWFLVDPNAQKIEGQFFVAGTGQEIPVGAIYLKSCIDGSFVWHLFGFPIEEA